MVRQVNSATFFLTLSAAETKESLAVLSLVVDNKKISLEDAKNLEFSEKVRT